MLRRALVILVLVLGIGLSLLLLQKCRNDATGDRAVSVEKTEEAERTAAASKDSVAAKEPGVQRADTAFSHQLDRPRPAPPIVRVIVDTVAGKPDTTGWVPLAVHVADSARIDSLVISGRAYRDSTRSIMALTARTIQRQDSIIFWQRKTIDTPKPRRRWGLGVYSGYGATKTGSDVKAGPKVGIGFSFTL